MGSRFVTPIRPSASAKKNVSALTNCLLRHAIRSLRCSGVRILIPGLVVSCFSKCKGSEGGFNVVRENGYFPSKLACSSPVPYKVRKHLVRTKRVRAGESSTRQRLSTFVRHTIIWIGFRFCKRIISCHARVQHTGARSCLGPLSDVSTEMSNKQSGVAVFPNSNEPTKKPGFICSSFQLHHGRAANYCSGTSPRHCRLRWRCRHREA